jgi:ribosomal protein L20A (L18A)
MSKSFIVKGKAKIGIKWEKFEKTVVANTKERAQDVALCTMGGNHKVKRFEIKVESVEESKAGEK